MFDSVAFNVVIGLIFVYLLYSLLATVLSEIIATKLSLRGRNLKEAIGRMLDDEQHDGFWRRLWDSLRLLKTSDSPVVDEFYNHPEIKYLGSTGIFKNLSSFKAVSFSKTLLNMFTNDQPVTKELLDGILGTNGAGPQKIPLPGTHSRRSNLSIDPSTSAYIRILWGEAKGDTAKFAFLLEGWFDRTMEQATEWYKRKIQIVLLLIGFSLAWLFNADTFAIVKKLSVDRDAREKMVNMATAYIQTHGRPHEIELPSSPSSTTATSDTSGSGALAEYKREQQKKLDSLLSVKNLLEADVRGANNLLGLGAWLPDSLMVQIKGSLLNGCECKKEANRRQQHSCYLLYSDRYDYWFQRSGNNIKKAKDNKTALVYFSFGNKFSYLFSLLGHHFFGFLITAIAVSLGAPFWFDMLNKLMRLRTSTKEETDTPQASQQGIAK